MVITASFALVGIWFGEGFPEAYFKTMVTFLIFGIASFLFWAPLMAYQFLIKNE